MRPTQQWRTDKKNIGGSKNPPGGGKKKWRTKKKVAAETGVYESSIGGGKLTPGGSGTLPHFAPAFCSEWLLKLVTCNLSKRFQGPLAMDYKVDDVKRNLGKSVSFINYLTPACLHFPAVPYPMVRLRRSVKMRIFMPHTQKFTSFENNLKHN